MEKLMDFTSWEVKNILDPTDHLNLCRVSEAK